MSDRNIRAFHLAIPKNRRIIVISDIHANLTALKRLLKKVDYQRKSDELILLGDLLEKGKENLAVLHYIMNLSQNSHVHPMIGNCDYVCLNVLYDQRLDFLKQILLQRKHSILHEMAAQLSIIIDESCDMYVLAKALRAHFLDELEFIARLPHVIETDDYIFAHAAIINEKNYGHDTRDIMKHDLFLKEDLYFNKYIIVGHLPVSEYCEEIASFMPLINERKHIICIDGGNVVKESGQLNALMIQDKSFQSVYVDNLPIAIIKKEQNARNSHPLFITWHDSEVEILQAQKHRSHCLHIASKRVLWIPNSFLYHDQLGNVHAANYTTYHHTVKSGDVVGIITYEWNKVLVKKDGVLGWIAKECLSWSLK